MFQYCVRVLGKNLRRSTLKVIFMLQSSLAAQLWQSLNYDFEISIMTSLAKFVEKDNLIFPIFSSVRSSNTV